MKAFIGLILVILALLCMWFFSFPKILVLGLMIFLAFVGGLLGGSTSYKSTRDSDNLAAIAQIERNRYFRKGD